MFRPKPRRQVWRKKKTGINCPCFFGAGEQVRTANLNLGKVALCQLSYARIYNCPRRGTKNSPKLAGAGGLEPSTNGLENRCSIHWATLPLDKMQKFYLQLSHSLCLPEPWRQVFFCQNAFLYNPYPSSRTFSKKKAGRSNNAPPRNTTKFATV